MATLRTKLDLDRCPYCKVDQPNLNVVYGQETADYTGANRRFWRMYRCERCGGMVTAASSVGFDEIVAHVYPAPQDVDTAVPGNARTYLQQAINSLHSPAGAVMLAASAVDAMLKIKGYKEGSLNQRIDKAAADHLITSEMAQWAHEVRLDANEQRHADESAPLPTGEDAGRCVEFALALGQFMFVLPARVQRGLTDAKPKSQGGAPSAK
jgi:hypothetical protein